MFVDGAMQTSTASIGANNLFGNTGALTINRALNPLAGQIDDVRVYNYALAAEQVKQVMNEGAVSFK